MVLTFVLLLAVGGLSAVATVPYVRFSPGPTVDVLGELSAGKPIISVDGHATYQTSGQFRMTTVSQTRRESRISLWAAMSAWASPAQALFPYDVIYGDDKTAEQDRSESQVEMVSSQDNATAAALTELGYRLASRPVVLQTVPGGAAEGQLKAHDVIVSANGSATTATKQVQDIVGALKPGETVALDVLRKGKPRSFTLTTKPSADDPEKAVIGILLGLGYDFPFQVTVNVPEEIGGPSAGLIFSLAIYDTLTPGELTGGKTIAGTGTIDEEGKVGPIGGIQQKIAAADEAGASLFLVPPDNCDEAVETRTDVELVRADTMHSALEAIKAYTANPKAELPACKGDS